MKNSQDIINSYEKNVMNTYGRLPLALNKGENSRAEDADGKKYIDFGSGIGTNSLGFCDKDWVDAVCTQANKLQHTSNYYYNSPNAEFAELLCDKTGYKKAFFGNSGAEANECAIKLARKYSFDKYGKGRHNIITLENSFHGRTLATISATGQEVFHNYFFPFVEGFIYSKANDINDLKSKLDGSICAIMLEYIQGEGGVIALNQDFVNEVYRIAEENDILVIADEVQTGAGRTGKFLAGEYFSKKANITTMAKGIAGGLPIGVCLADEKCGDVLTKGTHASTFGGNPICCAGGVAVLKKVNNSFLKEVSKKAEYIRKRLLEIHEIECLSGMGLMIGITLKTKNSAEILSKALDNGLMVLTAKEKLRLLPPLTITYKDIDEGINILKTLLD